MARSHSEIVLWNPVHSALQPCNGQKDKKIWNFFGPSGSLYTGLKGTIFASIPSLFHIGILIDARLSDFLDNNCDSFDNLINCQIIAIIPRYSQYSLDN